MGDDRISNRLESSQCSGARGCDLLGAVLAGAPHHDVGIPLVDAVFGDAQRRCDFGDGGPTDAGVAHGRCGVDENSRDKAQSQQCPVLFEVGEALVAGVVAVARREDGSHGGGVLRSSSGAVDEMLGGGKSRSGQCGADDAVTFDSGFVSRQFVERHPEILGLLMECRR